MKKRSGFSLIEVMIAVMVLSFTVSVFGAMFTSGHRLRSKSENMTRATTLAQQKVEQVRALAYSSLDYAGLHTVNVIDSTATTSPYSFTTVDGLAGKLPQGAGTLTLTSVATDLTRIDVTVTWAGLIQNGNTVTVTTLVANKAATTR